MPLNNVLRSLTSTFASRKNCSLILSIGPIIIPRKIENTGKEASYPAMGTFISQYWVEGHPARWRPVDSFGWLAWLMVSLLRNQETRRRADIGLLRRRAHWQGMMGKGGKVTLSPWRVYQGIHQTLIVVRPRLLLYESKYQRVQKKHLVGILPKLKNLYRDSSCTQT